MESPGGCIESDAARNNTYINDGSIHPTTLLKDRREEAPEAAEGNLVRLVIEKHLTEVWPVSMRTGQAFAHCVYQTEADAGEIEIPR